MGIEVAEGTSDKSDAGPPVKGHSRIKAPGQPEKLQEPVRLDLVSGLLRPPRRLDFAETLAHAEAQGRKLSIFLLDLYAAAVREPVGRFERSVFLLLEELIPLDAGWTGVAGAGGNRPVIHNSFTHRLPETFFREWLAVMHSDPLADLSRLIIGRANVINMTTATVDPVFSAWASRFGLAQLMHICAVDGQFGLFGFLSVYRFDPAQPFTAAEAEIIETVIPHLAAAMRINRTVQLFHLGRDGTGPVTRAICDAYGVIHRADTGFPESIKAEWPDWEGPALPAALCRHLQTTPDAALTGTTCRIGISSVAGLFVLELRPRTLIDRLGARELETIRHFASGASYKEVARQLNISPATVRHHLRSAYKKLGVHDKAQISRLIGGQDESTRPSR